MDMPGILSVIDDHGFADISSTRKVAAVNDTIWDICSRESWPFLEKSATLNFDGTNANPSNWPTDVAQVVSVVDTVNGGALRPIDLNEFRSGYSGMLTTQGLPYLYYFLAGQLFVFPVPSATQTLLMVYEVIPAAVTAASAEVDIIIPPRWHSTIWNGALAQLYDMDDDAELSVKFDTRFQQKLQLLRYQAFKRQIDSSDTILITDYEDIWD